MTRRVFITTACAALAGCATDPLEDAALEASRQGTIAAGRGGDPRGLAAGAAVMERYYYVAKYQATIEQRRIAETAARTEAPRAVKRARKAGRKTPRFIAVKTASDSRATTKTSVMVWDTESEQIVGNDVYDLNAAPSAGALVKFDTFSAEYVANRP